MSSTPRIVYCLMAIVTVLVISLAGTLGVLLWRYMTITDVLQDIETCRTEDLQTMFPGYFRTPDQQMLFLQQYRNTSRPVETYNPKYCTFDCSETRAITLTPPTVENVTTAPVNGNQPSNATQPPSNSPRKRRRDVSHSEAVMRMRSRADPLFRKKRAPPSDATILFGPVYHACCQSWRVVTAPTTAENLSGETVELVQDVSGFSQYFTWEHCEEDPTCTRCECDQPDPFVYSAVYYKDKTADKFKDKYGIDYITLPGCCKCLNI